ncbi:hypothetical protein [Ramlibacter sp.]|uniref:hypothetical protein n=1 Tax=Ramlibacter sp. TaxID=1917967 RepID=UPI00185CE71F|nr:hypothetical protein [Ramlibacter sp.]MBA2673517.1 hypothetical protein [Ramlibacter sp.]
MPEGKPQLRALADRLDGAAAQPACLRDAFFHAYRGAVLMALGEAAAAVEPLERALLMRPDLPAAELDLALALAATGQVQAASALLDELRARPDLPPALRAALDRQPANREGPSATAWLHRVQLTSLVGWDSNLNNAPSVSELTLTFPQGNVTLPLAPSSLPYPGAAVLNTLQWQGLRATGSSLWVAQAEIRARQTREGGTNYQQGDLALSWLQAPAAPRQWVVRGSTTRLRFGGADLLQIGRVQAQYQWPALGSPASPLGAVADLLAGCRPTAGYELESRHYPGTPDLDGMYQGLTAGLLCARGEQAAASTFSVQLRTGRDRPESGARPGGRQDRAEFRAAWDRPLASPWPGVLGPGRLGVQWASTRQADASGYSALLANNASRAITRHAFQAEASFALGGGLALLGSVEASAQRSNLEAFSVRQRGVYLGLRWTSM